MKRYEFRFEEFYDEDGRVTATPLTAEVVKRLNELGDDGWSPFLSGNLCLLRREKSR